MKEVGGRAEAHQEFHNGTWSMCEIFDESITCAHTYTHVQIFNTHIQIHPRTHKPFFEVALGVDLYHFGTTQALRDIFIWSA